jgi:hypothetical protein
MRLTRWGAPVAFVAVLAVVLGTAFWLARGDGGGAPTVLRLASASGERGSAIAADSTEPASSSGPAYKLVGTLPPGTPDDQPIYRLPAASADDAASVARALGLTGEPKQADEGWTVTDGDVQLVMRDDGSWSYGPSCGGPDGTVSDKDVMVGCAVASAGTAVAAAPDEPADGSATADCPPDTKCEDVEPVPAPLPAPEVSPGPSESEARAAAQPVFDALGLSDARVTVWPGDPTASVQASPTVDGLPTVGLVTYLQIDADGDVVWADGRLPVADRGADYPVISAADAFDQLLDQPRAVMDICMQRPDGEPGCAEVPPAEVTGGTLGLLLDYDGQRPVLVPAWLFDVKGEPEPVAQIAVDPSFLAPPAVDDEPVPVDGGDDTSSGSGSGSSGSSGSDPGTVEPAPPVESPAR